MAAPTWPTIHMPKQTGKMQMERLPAMLAVLSVVAVAVGVALVVTVAVAAEVMDHKIHESNTVLPPARVGKITAKVTERATTMTFFVTTTLVQESSFMVNRHRSAQIPKLHA